MTNKLKILILEDDQDINDLISLQFDRNQFEVQTFIESERAIDYLQSNQDIALFLIDWMLPGAINGLDFIAQIRSQAAHQNTPVIMITALSQPENIVKGLDGGADDYICKPFDLAILKARIRAQLRTVEKKLPKDENHIEISSLLIDQKKCRVTVSGEEISLTTTEYKILLLLMQNPGHVYTRAQLLNNIQGENIHVTGRTIDTHMASLRKKLGNSSEMIETIRGIGYRIKDDQ